MVKDNNYCMWFNTFSNLRKEGGGSHVFFFFNYFSNDIFFPHSVSICFQNKSCLIIKCWSAMACLLHFHSVVLVVARKIRKSVTLPNQSQHTISIYMRFETFSNILQQDSSVMARWWIIKCLFGCEGASKVAVWLPLSPYFYNLYYNYV